MRVFVTGASGFIGAAVAGAFRRAGHRVQGLARSADKAKRLHAEEIEPVLGDLATPAGWAVAAAQADVLVHCAFESSRDAVARDRAAVDTLLAAGRAGNGRTLIYTSGIWVYGDTGGESIDAAAPVRPLPLVAWRVPHEDLVLAAGGDGLRALVLRPGCVYGRAGSLTGFWFASAAAGEVEVLGDGRNHWTMIHVDDLAEAYVAAAASSLSGQALAVVDGSRYTADEMTAAVAVAAGIPGRRRYATVAEATAKVGPLAQGLLVDQQVDAASTERLLGWAPRHRSFVADVDLYWQAWQAHQERSMP